MTLAVLLFYFVATCSLVDDACASENYTAERWPGDGGYTDYDTFGPYFTREECETARRVIPHLYTGEGEGMMKMNPWSEPGMSVCYAREVRVVLP